MRNLLLNRRSSAILIISIIALFSFVYFSNVKKDELDSGKISIITSFYPLAFAANLVGADLVDVRNLVSAGVEAHDFEPSARDLVDIGRADLLIYNGAAFEPWIPRWQDSISAKPKHIVNMSESLHEQGVSLIEKEGVVDPHFWLDPTIMKSEITIIQNLLTEIDPTHRDFFAQNAMRALAKLDTLDQEYRTTLSSCSLNDIIVLHDAFSYVGRHNRISVNSIKGISPDEEPSPKDLIQIVNLAKEKGIKYVFFETVSSPKFSELIAREIGGTVLVLNPVESLTPDEVQLGEDYLSIMRMNLRNLQTALQCK